MTTTPRPPLKFDVPAGTPGKPCNGATCSTTIFFVKTKKGKSMPVDCSTEGGTMPTATSSGVGVAHWPLCPDRQDFKR